MPDLTKVPTGTSQETAQEEAHEGAKEVTEPPSPDRNIPGPLARWGLYSIPDGISA